MIIIITKQGNKETDQNERSRLGHEDRRYWWSIYQRKKEGGRVCLWPRGEIVQREERKSKERPPSSLEGVMGGGRTSLSV
jgi:hypothetical protein